MWKSVLLSIIAGLLLSIAWPTIGFAGFLFVAFIPLLLIEKQFSDAPFKYKSLRIFLLSWLAFFIWNALSYRWLSNAHPQVNPTESEIQQAWTAYGIAVIFNSLFMSIVFLLYHFIRKKQGEFFGFVFLPAMWMTFEKMHLNWDFSWPWLNLGNGFASYYKWIQWYEWSGSFGGTLWVWVANLLLFKAILLYLEHGNRKLIRKYVVAFIAVIVVPVAISLIMYSTYEELGEPVNVVVVQPELNPYKEKYNKSGMEIVQELTNVASAKVNSHTNLIITPETSFPGRNEILINQIHRDPYILYLSDWLQTYPQAVFVGGTQLAEITNATTSPNITSIHYKDDLWVNRFNSTIQLENTFDSIPYHHKSKLVVGVEFFPYPYLLKPLLGKAMLDFGGSTNSLTKTNRRTVFANSKNDAKVAPLICYESIYGEYTTEFVKNGANLISISTNDSWWGNTDGHRQLLEYARLRAIENRRSIARSANSGVSTFINQRGDIIDSLSYDTQGALEGQLKLNIKQTNYTYAGDLIARIALLISGVLLAYYIMERIMEKRKRV